MKNLKYCDDCEIIVKLSEEGYCLGCGKHADNMISNESKIFDILNKLK